MVGSAIVAVLRHMGHSGPMTARSHRDGWLGCLRSPVRKGKKNGRDYRHCTLAHWRPRRPPGVRRTAGRTATPEIGAAWRRCSLNYHLDPERMDQPALLSGMELRHSRDYAGRSSRAADPELERLHAAVDGLGWAWFCWKTCRVSMSRQRAGRR